MKIFMKRFALVLSLVFASSELYAGGEHAHDKGPHGGLVTGFGESFHIEAVRQGGKINFYLLDGDAKPGASIAKQSGGSITILTPGKPSAKSTISSGAFSEASAEAPEKGKVTAVITVKSDSKSLSAKFNFK